MSFGYHVNFPRIPGRPLGCCKECRQRARWDILRWMRASAKRCKRCGLVDGQLWRLVNLKRFVVFEDDAGNEVARFIEN